MAKKPKTHAQQTVTFLYAVGTPVRITVFDGLDNPNPDGDWCGVIDEARIDRDGKKSYSMMFRLGSEVQYVTIAESDVTPFEGASS